MATQGEGAKGSKDTSAAGGFEPYGEVNLDGGTSLEFGGIDQRDPTLVNGTRDVALPGVVGGPAVAVESGHGDTAPAQEWIVHRRTGAHAHHDRGAFLDFANLAKLDIVGEAAHEGWLRVGVGEVTGTEAREDEEKNRTKEHSASGNA